jgi:cytoplasmic iron level regulating protein YaaA (DUF328/UPF0246 family)
MKLLISPAKSLNETAEIPNISLSRPMFLEEADYLMQKLRKKSAQSLEKMMGISPDLAELNFNRNQNWDANGHETALPAGYLFNGGVYLGLDIHSLASQEIQFLQDHLFILSGLYGVLKPLDRIMPYRLEMGSSFAVTPKKTNLYRFWDQTLLNYLNSIEEPIVNLASNEYFKAIGTKGLNNLLVNMEFKEEKDGEFKMVGFFAKRARGLMVRFAAQTQAKTPADLALFNEDNYALNEALSDESNYVFTRPYPLPKK